MTDQTPAGFINSQGKTELQATISDPDRAILRELASQVAELAARPVEDAKRDLWYRHNALERTRPVVFCDPENGWNEIITPVDLACRGELARAWEMRLRKERFWGSVMCDDRVIQPFFDVAHVYTESDWGMHETRIGGEDGGAYVWDAPLKDYADLDRLHAPRIEVYADATAHMLALAEECVGHALTVRNKTMWWWSQGMTWTLINLRGLTQVMLDMTDHPDELHRLMAILRDGHAARMDFLEQGGYLSLNNDGTYVGSGGFGWSHELPQADFEGHVCTRDMWGFSESQETVQVSPRMFAEFVFPYQVPLLERFGLNCYGCCEPLDKRWWVVEQVPHLRRVSVSPWADPADMAEKLGPRYIYSLKPAPSDLAMPSFDEERIRAELRAVMRLCRAHDCRLEVIMKDNHTIARDPSRVVTWVRIAREEAERLD